MDSAPSDQHGGVQTAAARSDWRIVDFDQVYREEFTPVWRFLHRLGVRGQLLEDLTHDVFLLAYRRLESFDRSRAIRPWLYGIAFRVVSDFRVLARHEREVPGLDALPERAVDGPGPEEALHAREAKELVEAALATLGLEGRMVFVLHELEGRPVPEIAEVMGTPVPTAYTRLRAARQRFAKAVEHLSQGGTP